MPAVPTFTAEQQRTFDQFEAAFDRYGYFIEAEPIEGMEEVFLTDLRLAFGKVEEVAAYLRRTYRLRGISKRLLEELHIHLPAPSFNIESMIAPELRAKWNRRRT